MTSEIRANTLKNRVGLGTVSFTNTGPVVSGIVTIANSTAAGVTLEDNAGVGNSLKITTPTGYVSIGAGNATFVHLNTDRGIFYFQRRITVDEGIISSYDEDLVLQSPMNTNRVTINKTTGLVSIVNDLDVDGHTNLDNVSIAGVTTFTGNPTIYNADPQLTFRDSNHSPFYYYLKGRNGAFVIEDSVNGDRLSFNANSSISVTASMFQISGASNIIGNLSTGGTLTLPDSIIHTGDTDTKIRFPGNDNISFETGGTERLRIDSSGNMGMDASPQNYSNYKTFTVGAGSVGSIIALRGATSNFQHLIQNNNGSMIFKADVNNTSASTSILFQIDGSERLRITSDGKLSLGTSIHSSPAAALHIDNDTNNMLMLDNTTANTQKIFFAQDGAAHAQIFGTSASGGLTFESDPSNNHNNSYLNFVIDGSTKAYINSSGQMGLGIVSPQTNAKLQVVGNIGATQFYTTTTSTPQTDFTSSVTSNKAGLILHRASETNGDYGGLEFHGHPSSITAYRKGGIYFQTDGSGFGRGDIVICNDGAGDANNLTLSDEKMRIHKEGHVTKQHSCAFNVTHNGHQNYSSAGTHHISSWKTTDSFRGFEHTSGGGYFSNGVFTAPVTGAYFFTGTLLLNGLSGTNDVHVFWDKNGSRFTYWETRFNGNPTGYGNYEPVSGQCVMKMDAGDTCRIKIDFSGSGCGIHGSDQNWGNWGGFLIG